MNTHDALAVLAMAMSTGFFVGLAIKLHKSQRPKQLVAKSIKLFLLITLIFALISLFLLSVERSMQ